MNGRDQLANLFTPTNAPTPQDPLFGMAPGGVQLAGKAGLIGDIFKARPTNTPARILNQTKKTGGYTVGMNEGTIPQDGFMVGMYKNREYVVPINKLSKNEIEGYIAKNAKVLDQKGNYLGTWVDGDLVYMDVARRFDPEARRQAFVTGDRKAQKEIFDLAAGESMKITPWKEYIHSPMFADKMNKMFMYGKSYMDKNPHPDWWPLKGSSYERVYGENMMEPVAGYNAATSPNTPLVWNVKDASEYIRREIKGEPVLQPDFRKPGGQKMPMEQTRAKNLERVRAGKANELTRDKVNAMYRAQMGDPEAVVLDTHYAKIGEDPLMDVYLDTKSGIVPSGPIYQEMQNVVRDLAHAQGYDPQYFSSSVWVGIREWIKDNGELFGTKFRLNGESKAMADVFDDQIKLKAKELGIDVPEMENRLRKGDANLLSSVLATPIGSYVFWSATHGDDSGTGRGGTP